MKTLLSYSLLGAGLFCMTSGLFIVVDAQAHQSSVLRPWTEPRLISEKSRTQFPAGAIARLRFPRLGRDVFVWGDEHPANLKKGPVWLRMTQGFTSNGNTVVAGHRDTHFRFLKDAKVGDIFEVVQDNRHLTFRVSMMAIVRPQDRALLAPTAEKAVTLVTCYPFFMVGRANRRMIIRAELAEPQTLRGQIN